MREHDPTVVLTIGHSNHESDEFIALLQQAGVQVLVDVRSQPYSRYSPQFSKGVLERAVEDAGIEYRHMPALGGRPDGDEYYDEWGHALYGVYAESEVFQEGIASLVRAIEGSIVAVMCSEEDPKDCHRRLLVGRVLDEHGIRSVHIRKGGDLESEDELVEREGAAAQEGLFDQGGELPSWRSIQPVLRNGRPPTSSPR